MNWLTVSARLISKSVPGDRVVEAMELDKRSKNGTTRVTNLWRKEQMSAVVWTTPLGLPIVQPYRKVKRKQVITSVQSVFISDPNAPAESEYNSSLDIAVDEVLILFYFSKSTPKSRRRLSHLTLSIA